MTLENTECYSSPSFGWWVLGPLAVSLGLNSSALHSPLAFQVRFSTVSCLLGISRILCIVNYQCQGNIWHSPAASNPRSDLRIYSLRSPGNLKHWESFSTHFSYHCSALTVLTVRVFHLSFEHLNLFNLWRHGVKKRLFRSLGWLNPLVQGDEHKNGYLLNQWD